MLMYHEGGGGGSEKFCLEVDVFFLSVSRVWYVCEAKPVERQLPKTFFSFLWAGCVMCAKPVQRQLPKTFFFSVIRVWYVCETCATTAAQNVFLLSVRRVWYVCEACATTAAQNVFLLSVSRVWYVCEACATTAVPRVRTRPSRPRRAGGTYCSYSRWSARPWAWLWPGRYHTPQNQCIEYGSGSAVIKVNWVLGIALDTDLHVSAFRIDLLLRGPDPVGTK